jgi:hypothetical protein
VRHFKLTKVRGARQDSQPSASQIQDGNGAESVFRCYWRHGEMVADFHAFEMIYDSADYSCSVDVELCDGDDY